MTTHRALQIVPAGARQVAPGIFQMTRRGGARGGGHRKQHHAKKHRGGLALMSQSFVRYVKLLNEFRRFATSFTAPDWLNVPALLLYMHGQNKHDKGAMNVAKTMLLDQAAQKNPQIAGLLQAGAGDMGLLGLMGGMGGFGFGGGAPGFAPKFSPEVFQAPSPPAGGGNTSTDVSNAVALMDAFNRTNNRNA